MARRRRGDRGQRRAGHRDDGDHRHRRLAARQLGLPRAAVPGHGARPGRPVRPARARRRRSSTSSAPGPRRYGIRVSFAEPRDGRPAGLRRHGHPALLATGRVRRRRRPVGERRAVSRAADHARRREPAHDRRSWPSSSGCSSSSSSAPRRRHAARPAVGAGPDRPRRQPQRPQRPAAHGDRRRSSGSWRRSPPTEARGDVSVDEIQRRPRARPRLRRARPGQRARASRSRSAARSTGTGSRS